MHSLMKPIALVNLSHAHPYMVGTFFEPVGTTLLMLMGLANTVHVLMDLKELPHGHANLFANLFRHMPLLCTVSRPWPHYHLCQCAM